MPPSTRADCAKGTFGVVGTHPRRWTDRLGSSECANGFRRFPASHCARRVSGFGVSVAVLTIPSPTPKWCTQPAHRHCCAFRCVDGCPGPSRPSFRQTCHACEYAACSLECSSPLLMLRASAQAPARHLPVHTLLAVTECPHSRSCKLRFCMLSHAASYCSCPLLFCPFAWSRTRASRCCSLSHIYCCCSFCLLTIPAWTSHLQLFTQGQMYMAQTCCNIRGVCFECLSVFFCFATQKAP